VYVIYRVEQGNAEVAKYGITCQTESDGDPSCKRPEEQVKQFNIENDVGVYFYSIVNPFPGSRLLAFTIERAMTAGYIIANAGQLPLKNHLPCFVKIPDSLPSLEKIEKGIKRIKRANQFIEDMIKQYGK